MCCANSKSYFTAITSANGASTTCSKYKCEVPMNDPLESISDYITYASTFHL